MNKREITLLNYKHRLTNAQTPQEKKFAGLLMQAREIREAHRNSRSTIHRQYLFTDGETGYIADFYIPYYKLAFEIDGYHHAKQSEYDEKRTQFLQDHFNVRVVRFWNDEINSPNIIKEISAELTNKRKA